MLFHCMPVGTLPWNRLIKVDLIKRRFEILDLKDCADT